MLLVKQGLWEPRFMFVLLNGGMSWLWVHARAGLNSACDVWTGTHSQARDDGLMGNGSTCSRHKMSLLLRSMHRGLWMRCI